MKQLSKLDLFVQEKILLAIHKWCTIEEARKKELPLFWCMVIDILHHFFWELTPEMMIKIYWSEECVEDDGYTFLHYRWNPTVSAWLDNLLDVERFNIIWLPPTLPRILHTLGDMYLYRDDNIYYINLQFHTDDFICKRKLLNEDWTDCDFFDQSEETKQKIWELLWYNLSI